MLSFCPACLPQDSGNRRDSLSSEGHTFSERHILFRTSSMMVVAKPADLSPSRHSAFMRGFIVTTANSSRRYPQMMRSDDLYSLPPNLPIPGDDGACDHLAGLLWPAV